MIVQVIGDCTGAEQVNWCRVAEVLVQTVAEHDMQMFR